MNMVQAKTISTKKKPPAPRTFSPRVADLKDAPQRAKKILAVLQKTHPDAKCALNHSNALELLVATILSAQCTDERVNIVTRDLFKTHRTAADYADADQEQLAEAIKSAGFYRNKAKSIKAACTDIVTKFNGEVPDNMAALISLAGVGRKTANVILGNAFNVPGITTDTHVIRLSRLMGLSRQTAPVKLEIDLMKLIPKKHWTQFSHTMIFQGRRICIARKPDCPNCPIRPHCCFGQLTQNP